MYDHSDICSLFSKKAPSNLFASSGCLNFTLLTKAPAPSSPILHLHPDLSTVYDILRKIPSTLSSLFRSMKVSGHVAGCPRCTVQLQSLLLWRTGATEGYGKKKKERWIAACTGALMLRKSWEIYGDIDQDHLACSEACKALHHIFSQTLGYSGNFIRIYSQW